MTISPGSCGLPLFHRLYVEFLPYSRQARYGTRIQVNNSTSRHTPTQTVPVKVWSDSQTCATANTQLYKNENEKNSSTFHRKWVYLLSGRGLDEKINGTLTSVR